MIKHSHAHPYKYFRAFLIFDLDINRTTLCIFLLSYSHCLRYLWDVVICSCCSLIFTGIDEFTMKITAYVITGKECIVISERFHVLATWWGMSCAVSLGLPVCLVAVVCEGRQSYMSGQVALSPRVLCHVCASLAQQDSRSQGAAAPSFLGSGCR